MAKKYTCPLTNEPERKAAQGTVWEGRAGAPQLSLRQRESCRHRARKRETSDSGRGRDTQRRRERRGSGTQTQRRRAQRHREGQVCKVVDTGRRRHRDDQTGRDGRGHAGRAGPRGHRGAEVPGEEVRRQRARSPCSEALGYMTQHLVLCV